MGEAKRNKHKGVVVEYAEFCSIPLKLAERRVKAFDLAGIKYRRALKCPKCKKNTLCIDSTDFEFTNNESWVWCSECGFTGDITPKYEPLSFYYGFDIVRAMSNEREEQFGDGWEDFVLKDTIEVEKEYGVIKE